MTQEANFENFLFPNSAFNIRKSYKFLTEKLSTSEVISQKSRGGWKTPPPHKEAQLIFKLSEDDKILQFYMISVSFFRVFI